MPGKISFTCQQLIDKLNLYLKIQQRDVVLQGGYCHGLTLLWLNLMSRQEEAWLYELAERIVTTDVERIRSVDNDIEILISYLEWLQHSSHYEYQVNQSDISELTNLNVVGALSFLLTHNELEKLIKRALEEHAFIRVSSHDHTVGVAIRNDKLYLFDAEFNNLQPKVFTSVKLLKSALIKSLFRRSYIPAVRLPIHLTALSCTQYNNKNALAGIYQYLMQRNNLDEPGFQRLTNLYLASEVGDVSMVNDLLQKGVDPNQAVKTWSPLHVAAAHGHVSVVQALLKFGAIASAKNHHKQTPKELAENFHHDEVVQLLK